MGILFDPRAVLRLAGGSLLFAIACGGETTCGGGCAGCDPTDYQYPEGDPIRPDAVVQDDVLRVRITQDFLDFVRPQLPGLLRDQLANLGGDLTVDNDNILHIPLPDQNVFDIGIAEAQLRQAEALVWLDDLDQSIDLQFEAPNLVRLSIAGLRVGIDARIKENFAGTTSSCPVVGDRTSPTPGGRRHAAEVSIAATIDAGVGPRPDYDLDIRSSVDGVTFGELGIDVVDDSIYCQEPECQDCLIEVFGTCLDPGGRCVECRIFCGLVTDAVLNVATSLVDVLGPLLAGILDPVVEDLLGDSLNTINGTPAKFEQQIDLAVLSGLGPLAGAEPIGVLITPESGRFPVVDRGAGQGMEITVKAGAEANLADCVVDPGIFAETAGPMPLPAATDQAGRPYHVFATISSAYLNQLLYAVHRSGALCLKLSTHEIRELTGGQFTLNASLLSLLAPGLEKLADDNAPVILELKPNNAAQISLGTGEAIGRDAEGRDQFDWLFQLGLDQLGVAFHVLIHDRYVRVFEVTADAFVGMNLTVLPDNRLEIAVGEIRIDDFAETFNELLPHADVAEVLPTLLDIGLGAVLSQAITFDLDLAEAVSGALGNLPLSLRVNEIVRDGPAEDHLTLTLTFTESPARSVANASVETFAELAQEPGLVETVDGMHRSSGRVRLKVGGAYEGPTRTLEYQIRVDQGLWRAAQPAEPGGTLLVHDPKLRVPGRHLIEVRARLADDYTSLDTTPQALSVLVDPFPPSLSATFTETGLEVRVRDPQTPDVQALRLDMQIDADPWQAVILAEADGAALGFVDYADLQNAQTVTLQARDPSGNRSTQTLTLPASVAPDETESSTGCACFAVGSVTETQTTSSAGWILVFLTGLALSRRRMKG